MMSAYSKHCLAQNSVWSVVYFSQGGPLLICLLVCRKCEEHALKQSTRLLFHACFSSSPGAAGLFYQVRRCMPSHIPCIHSWLLRLSKYLLLASCTAVRQCWCVQRSQVPVWATQPCMELSHGTRHSISRGASQASLSLVSALLVGCIRRWDLLDPRPQLHVHLPCHPGSTRCAVYLKLSTQCFWSWPAQTL